MVRIKKQRSATPSFGSRRVRTNMLARNRLALQETSATLTSLWREQNRNAVAMYADSERRHRSLADTFPEI
jgi:hypothetical protein